GDGHVGKAIRGDARGCGHAGTDAGILLVEDQPEIEVADRRPSGGEIDARQDRDQIDLRGEILARHRFDLDGGRLTDLQAAAIRFVQPRLEMNRRQIGQLEDAGARPAPVAFAELDAAAAERSAGPRVFEDVDGAVSRRAQTHRFDRLQRAIDVELRLVALALLAGELGVGPGLRRQRLGFDFLQALLGVAERQLRRLVFDPRDEVALAEIELRPLDVVPRLHQLGGLLLGGDLRLLLGLLDLAFGGLQVRLTLGQALRQLRRIELDEDVPLLHCRAVLHQLDDLEIAAGLQRRREHHRLRRTDVAANLDVVHEVAARHVGGRHVGDRAAARVHRDRRARDREQDDHDGERAPVPEDLHLAGAAALRATVTPSWSPAAMTASWVFIGPMVTSWRSSRPPRCTRT